MRKVFIDCGSWYGNSIAKFRSIYEDWQEYDIYAFEANKEVCSVGEKAIQDVTWINAGVWDSNCERTLRTGIGKWSESSTFFKHKKYSSDDREKMHQKVKCIDLAECIKGEFDRNDYIVLKMNIEGAEYRVLNKLIDTGVIDYINELYVDWHWHKMSLPKDDHDKVVDKLPIQAKSWNNSHQKRCIYTVLIGQSDKYTLKEPVYKNDNWDYICFTDRSDLKSKTWHIRQVNECSKWDPVYLSRKIKILCDYYLPDYNMSLYVDSKFTQRVNLDKFIANFACDYFTVMSHPKRNCVFDELKKLNKKELSFYYKNIGMPQNYGLFAPGIMFRKHHSKKMISFCNKWFDEIERCVLDNKHNPNFRDIPALSFVSWKTGVKPDIMKFKTVTSIFK